MKILRITSAAMAVALLAACQQMQDSPKQTAGTVVGAGLGALAGSQIGSGTGQLAAVALGTLGGAFLGSEVGKSLDRADKMYAAQTAQQALETNKTGQTASWTNPDTGHSGSVTPTRTYQKAGGQYCREYQTTIVVDGKSETAYGTACRQPDGSWKLVQ